MIGYTTVTFREKSIDQAIEIAKKAGLNGIEWGGDVQVPAGNIDIAAEAKTKTIAAGLKVISYGSYYRLAETPKEEFAKVLASAEVLGASIIRVWAGTKGSRDADDAYYQAVADDAVRVAMMAKEKNIQVAMEFHRQTLSDTGESASKLISMCSGFLKTYWQPNPDLTFEERKAELKAMLPHLVCVHCFYWIGANVRYPLADGEAEWKEFMEIIKPSYSDMPYVLEFIKGDSDEQFMADTKTLKSWL